MSSHSVVQRYHAKPAFPRHRHPFKMCHLFIVLLLSTHAGLQPAQTYSGEFVRLCTRCQVMLTMSESEMLAIVHTFANERQFVDDMPFSMGNEAEQSVLAAGQGASFSTAVATAAAAAAAASVTESAERTLMAMEDKATPLVEEVAAVAAYQNWTFDECNAHPGLFDHLAKTERVRFGDKDTKVVTAQEVERYEREEDNRPWATAEDVAPALAGGLFSSLPRYSKRMAVFGMAAAAVGLIAWGARRR